MIRLRARVLASLPLVALLSLGSAPSRGVAAASGDERVAGIAKGYFAANFRSTPSTATSAGVHDFDAQLDDMSAGAMRARLARDRATLASLEGIAPDGLSADAALDRRMLTDALRDDLLLNGTLAQWRHNPDAYVGLASGSVYGLIEREFAPPAVRMRDVVARERAIPRLVEQAEANLTTVDAATKEIAGEDARGALGFLRNDVPEAFAGVRDPALRGKLRASTAVAVAAMTRFGRYIDGIRPQGTFAIGRDAYEQRLRYEDALDVPVDQYLAVGRAALTATRAAFVATARRIDPAKKPGAVYVEVAKVHPPPSQLLAAASGDLVKLRAFLIAHHIVTLPPDADITVVRTPPFQRAFVTAQMDPPGPLERVATRAYYNVTPADPAWPEARQEGYLSQFNDFQRPIISAHEVYPGHFVNFTVDRHLTLSLTRRLLWNSEFGEGWAHYSEQMMVDEGFGGGDPRVRLVQLNEALLRECRYVAGVELHTGGWTIERAERLFTDSCFQKPAVALEETMRGTQDPMYGYYTLGKLMILKLRDDYRNKLGPAYTLEKFHDALLAHGDPPVPLLRPFLLGANDDGKAL